MNEKKLETEKEESKRDGRGIYEKYRTVKGKQEVKEIKKTCKLYKT